MKVYLIVLTSRYNRDAVVQHLGNLEETEFWFYSLPHSFFLKTSLTAHQISKEIIKNFGKFRHFVTEVSDNRQGLLPKGHWQHF
jgi:hypothetical protein